ncbi:MAG: oxidoreductase [Bacteroidales bacterium]|nr:MAG: oxidoreductase [Bacteroidales bacterium]
MDSWNDSKYFETVVIDNTNLAQDAFILKFKRNFTFKAGQVIGLGVNTAIEPRLYSIASGETDETIEILYTEKSDGKLTPMLSILKKGEIILVTNPFGTFTEYSDSPICISTGTGVAPFISMLKSGKGRNATFIHGVRIPEYFYFEDFLKSTLGSSYIQCCSGSNSPQYYNGRVTKYLLENLINPSKKYYLCGVAEMVVEVRDILISKGVPYGNIISEIYF